MLSLLSKTVRAQPCKFGESVGCCFSLLFFLFFFCCFFVFLIYIVLFFFFRPPEPTNKPLIIKTGLDLELSLGYMLSVSTQAKAFSVYRKELPKLSQMMSSSTGSSSSSSGSSSSKSSTRKGIFLDSASFHRYIVLFRLGERVGTIWQQRELTSQCEVMSSNMRWWNVLVRLVFVGIDFY